ncbi:MAG TPA: hypothetical protein VFO41_05755 [Alphaproteobacteria bacterium]|nr:hypothetical protein [Alphaproteobacteria bacterium]
MAARNIEQEFDTLRADLDILRADIVSLTKALGENVKDVAREQELRARAAVRGAGTKLDEARLQARLKAREGATALEEQIEERPLTSVLVAFGLGLLLGKLMDR